MNEELKNRLIFLAEKYETPDFVNDDPSRVLRRYSTLKDTELAAFCAAMLAFGQRQQFLQKCEIIFAAADNAGGFYEWIKSRAYQALFNDSPKKFYRFYSYADMRALFDRMYAIIEESGTLEEYYKKMLTQTGGDYAFALSQCFAGCKIVPQGKNCANKRLWMYLRWMVRTGSCVDLGCWCWLNPANLLIPLDTHVLSQSQKLGLLPPDAGATRKSAVLLTSQLAEIWQNDPAKGDFALFGLGVDKTEKAGSGLGGDGGVL